MNHTILPLATFLAGLGFGAVIGSSDRVRRFVHVPTDGQARRNDLATRLLGLVVLLVVGATSITSSHVTECQSRWNAEFRAGLVARSQAAAAESASDNVYLGAQEDYLRAVTSPGVAPDVRTQALAKYLTALSARRASLRQLAQSRQDHPVTSEPDCGQ